MQTHNIRDVHKFISYLWLREGGRGKTGESAGNKPVKPEIVLENGIHRNDMGSGVRIAQLNLVIF